MPRPLVNVLIPPVEVGLMTLDEAKTLLHVTDTSHDDQIAMLIDMTSQAMAVEANRRTFGKEKVAERWDCTGPEICCVDGTCKVYLTSVPVQPDDVESVETPEGTLIDPSGYRLETDTGQLVLVGGCSKEILITYAGGYLLPDDAPLDLQQLCGLMIRQFQAQVAVASTSGSGIRMLAHKDSRVMYFSPKDMMGLFAAGPGAISASAGAMRSILSKYTRYWI